VIMGSLANKKSLKKNDNFACTESRQR